MNLTTGAVVAEVVVLTTVGLVRNRRVGLGVVVRLGEVVAMPSVVGCGGAVVVSRTTSVSSLSSLK